MITAIQIINGAAVDLGVKTAEIALESDDFNVFFDKMNDMLLEWADLGLTPAFIEVFNGSDTVNIDDNARAAVKANLAARCASAFQKTITLELASLASDTLEKLQISTDFIGEIEYPDTLPLGSGNECSASDVDRRFFNQNKRENF